MINSFLKIISLLFFLFTLNSCTVLTKKETPKVAPVPVKQQLKNIQALIKKGQNKKAILKLNIISKKYENTDIADDALIILGDLHYKQQNYNDAYKAYISVSNSRYFSPDEADALLGAAKSLFKLGRYDESLSTVSKGLQNQDIKKSTSLALYKLKFNILYLIGDKLDALKTLIHLSKNTPSPDKSKKYQSQAMDYVESRLDEKQLEIVANDVNFGFVRSQALFTVANKYFEQKEFSKARDYYEEVIELKPGSEMANRSQQQVNQIIARRKVESKVIGAILPLSGKRAKYGYKTIRGLKLGLGIYGKSPSNFKLAIIDSESNPDSARRAVERLVVEDHTIAIVGSLLSKTSFAVATKANELGVPVIGLSQKSGLTEIGDFVFRNAITSSSQVKELVKTAMEKQGLKKFAILYPNDDYGVEYANLFWDEVLARGGEVVAAQHYKAKETDFNGPIKRLIGTFYMEDRKAEYTYLLKDWYKQQKYINSRIQPPSELLPPVVDFDAIFIPDRIKAVGQIAPTLAYNDVSKVKLLGTNLWNHNSLIRRGQHLVEKSIFVDSITKTHPKFKKSKFFKEFKKVYGEDPGIFEAQAYDVGLLLRQLIISGERSRIGLKEELQKTNNFSGSLGKLNMNANRELNRPMISLTVHEKNIIEADKAPYLFEELENTENK